MRIFLKKVVVVVVHHITVTQVDGDGVAGQDGEAGERTRRNGNVTSWNRIENTHLIIDNCYNHSFESSFFFSLFFLLIIFSYNQINKEKTKTICEGR